MLKISTNVKHRYPAARFGVMVVSGLDAGSSRSQMDEWTAVELERLKLRYSDYERKTALLATPLSHYAEYYSQFKKTYHVLGQLESVLLKGRGIPSAGIPVEAMFLAELQSLLLTAGHDRDLIDGTLTVDLAGSPLVYPGISGKEQRLAAGDLYLSGPAGILSSILGGPDNRTRITADTRRAMYFVYGVEGITDEQIRNHFDLIYSCLTAVLSNVILESADIYT